LRLGERAGFDRTAWPVTAGIPFGDGQLPADAPVRVVTADGRAVAAQAAPLATWRADRQFVQWLLVDFQADLAAGESRELFLEYGPGVEAASPGAVVSVTDEGRERLCIDTGSMRVELRPDDPRFIASCQLKTGRGWREQLRRPGPCLYMSDQAGTRYDTSAIAPQSIRVEERGPLRAVVCVRGRHTASDGRPFCPYMLRLHFYAGRSEIRVFHTFIYDQVPERVELADIGMTWPVETGGATRAAFGGDTLPHDGGRSARAELLQTSDLAYRVSGDGAPLGNGGKAPGWGLLSGDAGAVLTVVRDFWQEYPKGLAADRTNGAALDVRIWPSARKDSLKFSTPWKAILRFDQAARRRIIDRRDEAAFQDAVAQNPGAGLCLGNFGLDPLTREEFEWVEYLVRKYAPDRPATYNDPGTHNGYGAAKTTEFVMRFAPEPIGNEAADAFARCVQEPVIPVVDPRHVAGTLALRPFAGVDPGRFPEAACWMDRLFERAVAEPKRKLRVYGMIDYGDRPSPHAVAPSNLWIYSRDEPDVIERMKHCSRAFNMEANDQLLSMWGFFLNSGQAEHFLEAEAYGEHYGDVDWYHAGTSGGWAHRHGAHHWTGGPEPSHSCITGLLLQYYLTGNRRLLDICREAAERVAENREPCGIYASRRLNLTREYSGPVNTLLQYYQATWESRYGEMARRSLKWLCLTMDEPGKWPRKVATGGEHGDEALLVEGPLLRHPGGMVPQLLYDAVRVFGDREPLFKACLLGLAHRYVWSDGPHEERAFELGEAKVPRQDLMNNHSLVAYAYALSGDPVYAAWCEYYLREVFPRTARRETEEPDLRHVIPYRLPGEEAAPQQQPATLEPNGSIFNATWWASLAPPMAWAVLEAEKKLGPDGLRRVQEAWIRTATDRHAPGRSQLADPPEVLNRRVRKLGRIRGYGDGSPSTRETGRNTCGSKS
jgi:hypothetical protein